MTPLDPFSPYGVAKAAAFYQTRNYRESYDIHASAGIFFGFESPLRPPTFVTPETIIRGVAEIVSGTTDKLHLGNLSVVRDWGWAPEYMAAALTTWPSSRNPGTWSSQRVSPIA